MTYTVAAGVGLVAAVVVDLAVLRTRLVISRLFWVAYAIVFGFQLLINGILTTRGVVRYPESAIVGVRLVGAPVEDLVFGFALVLLTLGLWTRAGRHATP